MATVAEPESSLVRDVVDQENAKPAAEQESRMIDIPTEEEILAMMAEIRENPQEFRFVE